MLQNRSLRPRAKLRVGREVFDLTEAAVAALLLIPSLAFLVFTFLLPLIDVLRLSLTNFNLTTKEQLFIGLANYKYLLSYPKFWKSIANTCFYAAIKLSVDTSLALFLAVLLDKRIPLKRFLRASFFAPVVVPVVASSLIWIWFYDPTVGPFNQILGSLGLPKLRWLYDERTALISILIFSIWKGIGYNIVLFLSGLQNIPDSYTEAARVDGASESLIFWKIKFPLLRPITSFVLMIGVINSFKVFTEVNVMMPKNSQSAATLLIVNFIYGQAFTSGRMGRAMAASVMLFGIILALTMVQRLLHARKQVDYD